MSERQPACIYIYPYGCLLNDELRKQWKPFRKWSFRCLWCTIWVLEIKPELCKHSVSVFSFFFQHKRDWRFLDQILLSKILGSIIFINYWYGRTQSTATHDKIVFGFTKLKVKQATTQTNNQSFFYTLCFRFTLLGIFFEFLPLPTFKTGNAHAVGWNNIFLSKLVLVIRLIHPRTRKWY